MKNLVKILKKSVRPENQIKIFNEKEFLLKLNKLGQKLLVDTTDTQQAVTISGQTQMHPTIKK